MEFHTTTDKKNSEDKALEETVKKIKHKIMVMSGKGGVGKSTIATNLAYTLSKQGKKVGLLDIDIHGPNIPKMLGIEHKRLAGDEKKILAVEYSKNLKVVSMAFLLQDKDMPVIWRGPLKMSAIKQFIGEIEWGELDYLIMDLPPGTGDEPLSVAQLIPNSDGAIIVTTPQDVALLDSRKSVNFTKALKLPVIGIIENLSGLICPHCKREIPLFKTGGGEKAANEMNVPFLGRIPIDPDIVTTTDAGKPFVEAYEKSEAAKSFANIVRKIQETVEK